MAGCIRIDGKNSAIEQANKPVERRGKLLLAPPIRQRANTEHQFRNGHARDIEGFGSLLAQSVAHGGDRTIFTFNEHYAQRLDRPTLSLSFKDAPGGPITDIPATQRRVAPFFANLLPEGVLREYLATRAGVHSVREFFLLWVLGQDLPSAVTMAPADGEACPPQTGGLRAKGTSQEHEAALRFSLAGVQLKFSAIRHTAGMEGWSYQLE